MIKYKKSAFTLAEVLITLTIVGLIAAITLPATIASINERINSERQANIAQKITKAMEQMRAQGVLNTQYESTDAFVDELQKFLKISKRCSASKIDDCWPTKKVKTIDDNIFEVSNAKTRKDIIKGAGGKDTENVGLVLADGSAIILTYNTSAKGMDIGDLVTASNRNLPIGFGKSKEFPYTTSSTKSIDFIIDVNGKKGPNKELLDIKSFKSAKFSKGCAGAEVENIGCVVNLEQDYLPISEWPNNNNNNYWAGAREACKSIDFELPDRNTLINIFAVKNSYPELSSMNGSHFTSEGKSYGVYAVKCSGAGCIGQPLKSENLKAVCVGN